MNIRCFPPHQGMRRQGKRSPSPSNRLNQPSQSPDMQPPRDVTSAVRLPTMDSLLSEAASEQLLQYLRTQQSQLPINNTFNASRMQQPSNAVSFLRQSLPDNPMNWFLPAPIPAALATIRSEFDQQQQQPRQVQKT